MEEASHWLTDGCWKAKCRGASFIRVFVNKLTLQPSGNSLQCAEVHHSLTFRIELIELTRLNLYQ